MNKEVGSDIVRSIGSIEGSEKQSEEGMKSKSKGVGIQKGPEK